MMLSFLNTRITYIWVLLAALTTVSWGLADGIVVDTSSQFQWLTVTLLLLAFFKVRLVIMHFMEVATAPLPLRAIFEVWVLVVCIAINLLYLGYV
tara:strand:- start:12602 stop:12886 length:285 start_codon:yes stop_codon:yes gene_type:complete